MYQLKSSDFFLRVFDNDYLINVVWFSFFAEPGIVPAYEVTFIGGFSPLLLK